MKVTGSNPLKGPASTKRKSGASGDGFAPSSSAPSARAGASGGVSGTNAVASVEALLALQGAGDERPARERMTERAMSLLDVLDDLKIALLEGGLPRHKLAALTELLRTRRESVEDPGLEAALDEVETRAAVELAKYDA